MRFHQLLVIAKLTRLLVLFSSIRFPWASEAKKVSTLFPPKNIQNEETGDRSHGSMSPRRSLQTTTVPLIGGINGELTDLATDPINQLDVDIQTSSSSIMWFKRGFSYENFDDIGIDTDAAQWSGPVPAVRHGMEVKRCSLENQVVVQFKCIGDYCEQMEMLCAPIIGGTVSATTNSKYKNSLIIFPNRPLTCDPGDYIVGYGCYSTGGDNKYCPFMEILCATITVNDRPDGPTPDDSPLGDPPGTGGDPHFHTFSGSYFSYHGECDLVLMKHTTFGNGQGLEVHIRTTRVDNVKAQFSYVSGVAARLGKDVLEVDPEGALMVNRELRTFDGALANNIEKFAGFEVKKSFHGTNKKIIHYDLSLGGEETIQIRFNSKTKIIFVDINGIYPGSTGLLGSAEDDSLLSRDGSKDLSGNWNSFAEEWQVNDSDSRLFSEDRTPQFPQGCLYESSTTTNVKNLRQRRRLMEVAEQVSTRDAILACAHSTGRRKDFCIDDVLATGDLDLATDPFYN